MCYIIIVLHCLLLKRFSITHKRKPQAYLQPAHRRSPTETFYIQNSLFVALMRKDINFSLKSRNFFRFLRKNF